MIIRLYEWEPQESTALLTTSDNLESLNQTSLIAVYTPYIREVRRGNIGLYYPDNNEVYNLDTMKIIAWHKHYSKWWQRKLGLSDYQFLWLAFFKGILATVIVYLVVCIF